jgi:outer membrane immunogenic protein
MTSIRTLKLIGFGAWLAASGVLVSATLAKADEPNFSGPYVGLHAGYGWGDATTTQDVDDWGNDPKWIGPFSYDLEGGFGGGTVGYNWQRGNVVFGIEGDLGYMDLSGSRTSASSHAGHHVDHDVSGGLYAVAAARAGFAFGPTLVYAKGGWAWIDGEQSVATTVPGFAVNKSGSFDGLAYGGGIEYALNRNWSIKAEYLRIDLDDVHADQTSVTDDPVGHVYENHTGFDAIDTFKVGINWRFN